jgi:GntR family transcriptional regulator of gluconate operon
MGELAPGTHLGEPILAMEFGTSRGPIRDALQILVREGFVERLHNRRVVVKGMVIEDIVNLFKVRYLLESFALREWLNFSDAKPSDLMMILHYKTKMQSKLVNLHEFSRLDMEFHENLIRLSHNKSLVHSWLGLRDVISAIQEITNREHSRYDEIIQHHESIMTALQERDEEKVLVTLQLHLKNAEEIMIKNIKQMRSSGHEKDT